MCDIYDPLLTIRWFQMIGMIVIIPLVSSVARLMCFHLELPYHDSRSLSHLLILVGRKWDDLPSNTAIDSYWV